MEIEHFLRAEGITDREAVLAPITVGQSGSRVYRVQSAGGESSILKITNPQELPDYLTSGYPYIAVSEYKLYTELGPALELPLPALLGHGEMPAGGTYLLLEDLADSHFVPPVDHVWQRDDLRAILSLYANMHARAERYFATQGVPGWLHVDPRDTHCPEEAHQQLLEMAQNSWTAERVAPLVASPRLKQLLTEVTEKLAHVPVTLLFNDFYPPNVALPKGGGPALLFDWQLAGYGPLHVDIVNIGFMRESKSFGAIDKHAMLQFYVDELCRATRRSWDKNTFLQDYTYANVLAWLDFLPRFVRSVRRANATGAPWGQWMEDTFNTCVAELTQALL